MMSIETFRAKVLVILSESLDHALPIGHAAMRITNLYASSCVCGDEHICGEPAGCGRPHLCILMPKHETEHDCADERCH